MTPLRVLLADDHALVRAGIRSLLDRSPGIEVVGEARDGAEALALVATLRPDVLLMDVAMKGLNGLEAAARVREQFPAVRVVMLSMHGNEEYVMRALNAGVAGYLLKDAAAVELTLAIEAVARGETYLSPAISKLVVEEYMARVSGDGTSAGTLTPRQREILQRIVRGRSTKEIAFELGISVKTVDTHRAQLMDRLGIHDVAGLVRYAIRAGLLPPEG